MIAASKVAFAPRGKFQLASSLTRDLWEIGFKKATPASQPGFAKPPAKSNGGGAGGPVKFMGLGAGGALLLLGLGTLVARRRK